MIDCVRSDKHGYGIQVPTPKRDFSPTSNMDLPTNQHNVPSTLESFSDDHIESAVKAIFGTVDSSSPRRFTMEDILDVDDKSVSLLQSLPRWKVSIPHIERIIEAERATPTKKAGFVARTIRQQPGVVYAVRYWERLADTAAVKAALESVRAIWVTSSGQSDSYFYHSNGMAGLRPEREKSCDDASAGSVSNQAESTSAQPVRDHYPSPSVVDTQCILTNPTKCVPAASKTMDAQGEQHSFLNATDATGTDFQTVATSLGHAHAAQAHGAQTRNKNTTTRTIGITSLPEDTLSKQSSLVRVLGYAVGSTDPSQASVALVAEWPGVGSLHDLLMGRIKLGRGAASQEDLLRWTRQVAEGLVQVSGRGFGSGVGRNDLYLSTRNAYLFTRPQDKFQGSANVFDVRVATFLEGCPMQDVLESHERHHYVSPPELLWAERETGVPVSPTKRRIGMRPRSIDWEAADVWGIGALVFELATWQVAGPPALAFRQLRDLLRDVPISPRFIYGDVARGVMRIALQRQPGERARAGQIAAVVEQIATRTLRRMYTTFGRQSRVKGVRFQADGDESPVGKNEADGNGGPADDGYGPALAQWRIKEAVERAGGRARAFLRRLWFDSLTEDDKRRIRHRRRHRKANQAAREWRRRCVRAANMHHWTPAQVAGWILRLLIRAEASRKLPLLFSGDAKSGVIGTGGDDVNKSAYRSADAIRPKEGEGAAVAADAAPTNKKRATAPQAVISCAPETSTVEGVGMPALEESTVANGGDLGRIKAPRISEGDTTCAGHTCDKDEKESEGLSQGDVWRDDGDDVDLGGDIGAGKEGNAWADVEAGERTGYSRVAVEPFAVEEGINGACFMEAMDDALGRAEDALTRFVKGSVRVVRGTEVERKRVELVVKELLTIRPYSRQSHIKIRLLAVMVVRSAETPRNLTEDEINAQLPSLARVLTEGYRHQAAMVEQGTEFAASRIQGLARGKHIRRIMSSIWLQAEEYARDIVRGEREARMKEEKEQRAKEEEEAREREREEAMRYRLRLVPRVSSVTCRSLVMALPAFLVAAARGTKRFLVVETTVLPPSPTRQQLLYSPRVSTKALPRIESATVDKSDGEVLDGAKWQTSDRRECWKVRVLLRQGAAIELNAVAESMVSPTPQATTALPAPRSTTPDAESGNTAPSGNASAATTREGIEGLGKDVAQAARKFLRAVGDGTMIHGLRPCTTYRLTLEISPVVRQELLQSARSLGVEEAVRSLETATESETHGHGVGGNGGGAASPGAHFDVETLPDIPDKVVLVSCKVLTSASAVDPRDPTGVLSLRQWQSPYPGVAKMDGPLPDDYAILAPGRPEPLVSLQWKIPEGNGLDISRYTVERRVGRAGAWKKIHARLGETAKEGGRRRLPDAVDAPLRTISVDLLRKVAVHGLVLAYRVHAENLLGDGAPSEPLEVNLRAFLGHLRAQDGRDRAHAASNTLLAAAEEDNEQCFAPSMPSVCTPSCPERRDPAAATNASAGSVLPSATVDVGGSSCSKPVAIMAMEEECPQQQQQGPFDGADAAGNDTLGVTPHSGQTRERPSSASPGAFGGDFMGLEGFGEARVHNLFAPPSSSSRLHRRRPRETVSGAGIRDRPEYGRGSSSTHGPFPLPIVLVAGISGESRGANATVNSTRELRGKRHEQDSGRRARWDFGDSSHTGIPSDLQGGCTNNDVFHAFINLGRRLPGRLRRDSEER